MACPGVAGTMALIRQYYREVNPHTGDRKDQKEGPLGDGNGPSGALLKATLIAGAIPLSGHFTYRESRSAKRKTSKISDAGKPEHLSGYGRPQLDQVLRLSKTSSRRLLVIDRHEISQGSREHQHVFQVEGGGTWKAILTYTDAPGPVQEEWESGPVLINNLDLIASCTQPGDCNLSGAELTSDSNVDNTEVVPKFNGVRTHVKVLTTTKVTVRVVPKSIVTESQPYALVIAGTKLEHTAERSTKANWIPDWSLAVKKPAGSTTQVGEVQDIAVTVAIIVVSVLALAVVITGIWYCCTKKDPGEEPTTIGSAV